MIINKYMKHYIVRNKADDYGNEKLELVETKPEFARQYYHHREVEKEDVETLKKYIEFIDFEEEQERTKDSRFYGQD